MRLGPDISLCGTWKMQPESVGLDRPKGREWCDVPVPMPWTAFLSPASGVPHEMAPNRMAWFRCRVAVPEIPAFSRLVVHFEAVNFYAVVFVNGKRCGQHVGDAIPFDIDVTDFVTPRERVDLLVGVQDISYAEARGSGDRGRAADRRLLYPGLSHYPGIWGPVSLRVLPELHVADVRVRTTLPDLRGEPGLDEGHIRVAVAVRNESGRALGFSLTSELYDGARQAVAFAPVRGIVGPGDQTEFEMGTSWNSAALWWPDEPHLYTLRTALWSSLGAAPDTPGPGVVVDRVHTTIGFREFRMDGARFTLNHVPIQLRSEAVCPISGRLFGELPAGAVPAPIERAAARRYFEELKRTHGLNAVRFHRIPPGSDLLDAADEAGLLALVEFPLPDDERRYADDHPRFWVHACRLARQWVAARAHHPSVVLWSVDQGMTRRYGAGCVEGLQSLARTVADADPTRLVENSGDADLVDLDDVQVRGPLSVWMPATGVAFRTAGRYEADAVRRRIVRAADAEPGPWLPERPADRALCLMEHSRPATTPNSLAFFLGDAAYAAGVHLAEMAAPLTALEMGACRTAGLAAVHTIGRPPESAAPSRAAGDVVALPTELFANFYAGTRFVENLVLRNDTRFDQDFELVARFTAADGHVSEHTEELLLPAGAQERKPLAFDLPDIRKVQDADRAMSVLAELSVEMTGSRAGQFEHRRKIAIWPHVRTSGSRRIGLYDPDGRTASALSAVGATYSAAHKTPHGEFDTLVIGENALDAGAAPDAGAIREFVANGGLAIVLAQRDVPYDLSPVTTVLDAGYETSIAFVRDAEHPMLRGLSNFEMRWWQNDHRVAAGCFWKPSAGNFRCLVDAGGRRGLRWAAAVEVFHGAGSYVLSQIELVEKTARAPLAGVLLARLVGAAPSWKPLVARVGPDEEVFAPVGVEAPALPRDFNEHDLEETRVALLSGTGVGRLSTAQLRMLHEWVKHGGCLYLHRLEPGQERLIAALAARHITLVESRQDRLVLDRPGAGLARGLSSADLYFRDHGARTLGAAPHRVDAVTVVARTTGRVAGIASTVESPSEYALLALRAGKGRVVVDQVEWDVSTGADARSGRYVSTLLTNLGVPLHPAGALEPSARCEFADLTPVCNTALADPVPGDGEGWTDRGPDNDASAFSPGLVVAGGVPFRVVDVEGRSCCVLGPGRGPAAPPISLNRAARALAFLVACEGHAKRGTAIAHFTVRYEDGLETQVPLRYGVDVLDWNERGRKLAHAAVAWRGFTALGEPAAFYARTWENNRPSERIGTVTFSSTRAGPTPILLALTACAG